MAPLTPSDVLAGRTAHRTPVGMVVVLIVSGVCLLIALGSYALLGGPISTIIGLVLALPTAALLAGAVLLIDRLEPEPKTALAVAFFWGAGIAVLVALVLNTAGLLFVTEPALGEHAGMLVSAAIGAPPIEETAKGSVLFLLLWRRRGEIDGPTDGIVYAALVGLGFALVENVNYYVETLHEGRGVLLVTVVLRGVLAPLCHPMFTSMTGLGVAYAATHRRHRIVAVAGGWLLAVLLHSMWNLSTSFGFGGFAVAYLVMFGVLVFLIVVLVRDRHRIVRLINGYLPAYVPLGVLAPYDIPMLDTLRGRRQARSWALRNGGVTAARAMGDYQLAATELALLHARAAGGAVDPAAFARRRDALLWLMGAARQAFLARTGTPAAARAR